MGGRDRGGIDVGQQRVVEDHKMVVRLCTVFNRLPEGYCSSLANWPQAAQRILKSCAKTSKHCLLALRSSCICGRSLRRLRICHWSSSNLPLHTKSLPQLNGKIHLSDTTFPQRPAVDPLLVVRTCLAGSVGSNILPRTLASFPIEPDGGRAL